MKKEQEIKELINHFSQKLPHFPDGRIDYSNSDIAPVITIFITYKNQFLLLKRSSQVQTYKEKWNTVAGYLDNPYQNLFEKMIEELNEELQITKDMISSYSIGSKYQFTDEKNKITWIVHPVFANLKEKPKIILNFEHTDYVWITRDKIEEFDTVPNLKKSLKQAFSLI